MVDKSKAVDAKGPGDSCPACGSELVAPAKVTPKATRDNPEPGAVDQGVAKCASCGYVLTEPVKAEKSSSR
jgi:uncharacterized Zn finger protein